MSDVVPEMEDVLEVDAIEADASEGGPAPRNEGLGLRRLGGNAARTFIAQIAAMALGVSLSLLLARTLGEQGVGTYATALLLPLLMAQLLELGITYSNVYHIGRGDVNAHDVMRANVRIWAVVSAVGLIVSATVIWFWGAEWFPGIDRRLLMVSAFAFPPALLPAVLSVDPAGLPGLQALQLPDGDRAAHHARALGDLC